jgi:Kef-type K+ transport system membrane component KefB
MPWADAGHPDVPRTLGVLAVMLAAANLFGALAQRVGQPAVLGELVAGVILGTSAVGLVDPGNGVLHLLSEIGVVLLLFEIGLETDLGKLLKVGGASAAVAAAGVVLPFALGYGVCRLCGVGDLAAVVAGAALTATSVGITARVLADLGRLQQPEGQIILGAAVLDDVLGLVILAVVAGLAEGGTVTALGAMRVTAVAFGFLAVTLVAGRFVVPPAARWASRTGALGPPAALAVLLAFALAWLAAAAGSAPIMGAFAAGLLLRGAAEAHDIEEAAARLGHFFVPLFFVTVGAAVDLRVLNPAADPDAWRTLLVGGLLTAAAVAGKFAAGYAPFWFKGDKRVIGAGMVPRGEVGLIFAQTGLDSGAFDERLFSAVMLMVMVTTFLAPPLLRRLTPAAPAGPSPGAPPAPPPASA